jgi:hypothetical protein
MPLTTLFSPLYLQTLYHLVPLGVRSSCVVFPYIHLKNQGAGWRNFDLDYKRSLSLSLRVSFYTFIGS